MKKARSDASLKSLNPAQKETLCQWLMVENISYKEARKRVKAQFRLNVASDSTFTDFYHSVALPWSYAQSKGVADEFAKAAEGNFDPVIVRRLKQLLFEVSASRKTDYRALKALAQIVGNANKHTLNLERLDLDKRKVKLLEAKASLADQASAIAKDKSLTEEEQGARMRALFRM